MLLLVIFWAKLKGCFGDSNLLEVTSPLQLWELHPLTQAGPHLVRTALHIKSYAHHWYTYFKTCNRGCSCANCRERRLQVHPSRHFILDKCNTPSSQGNQINIPFGLHLNQGGCFSLTSLHRPKGTSPRAGIPQPANISPEENVTQMGSMVKLSSPIGSVMIRTVFCPCHTGYDEQSHRSLLQFMG